MSIKMNTLMKSNSNPNTNAKAYTNNNTDSKPLSTSSQICLELG